MQSNKADAQSPPTPSSTPSSKRVLRSETMKDCIRVIPQPFTSLHKARTASPKRISSKSAMTPTRSSFLEATGVTKKRKKSRRSKKKKAEVFEILEEELPQDTGLYDTVLGDFDVPEAISAPLPDDFFKQYAELEMGLNRGYRLSVMRSKLGGYTGVWFRTSKKPVIRR